MKRNLVRLFSLFFISLCCTFASCGLQATKELNYKLLDDGTYEVTGSQTKDLTKLVIPSTHNRKKVTSIREYAFFGCENLTSVRIPDSVTYIGFRAFENCSSLTSVKIPNSVQYILSNAFSGCSSLTSIKIPQSVTNIGVEVFSKCSKLSNIEVAKGNTVYHAIKNCLIETESKTLIAGCKNSEIPTDGSVTNIGERAFLDCTGLTTITIPDSVISIGDSSFFNCASLTDVTISDGVEIIQSGAFRACGSLTSVTVPNSVIRIGESAFADCNSLTSITLPFVGENADGKSNVRFGYIFGESYDRYGSRQYSIPTSLETVVITGGTSIGMKAFRDCNNLPSLTIPDSVTVIGASAFQGCDGLTRITYAGTTAQWNAIAKSDLGWRGTVICSDGTVAVQ